MLEKGILCPFCEKHIPENKIKVSYQNEIEKIKKLLEQLKNKEKIIKNKENELKIKEEKIDKKINYLENDLKQKQAKWDMQFSIDARNNKTIEYYDLL